MSSFTVSQILGGKKNASGPSFAPKALNRNRHKTNVDDQIQQTQQQQQQQQLQSQQQSEQKQQQTQHLDEESIRNKNNNNNDSNNSITILEQRQGTSRKRKRIEQIEEKIKSPPVKITISDYLHDAKSGKPTRAALKRQKQQEKARQKKKRQKLRAKGIEVESPDEAEEELELEESFVAPTSVNSFGANNIETQYTYDNLDAPLDIPSAREKDHLDLNGTYLEEEDEEEGELNEELSGTTDLVPQVQLDETGRIILNQASITVTRQSENIDYTQYERVTETFGSKHVTQATFSRKKIKHASKWSEEETKKFFDAIQQFGTDFSMIARLFPKRSRREIRNKFKKEEKQRNPALIEALKNRKPIDIELFKQLSAERDRLQGIVRNRITTNTLESVEDETSVQEEAHLEETVENEQVNDENEWESGALQNNTDETYAG